ncbi:MAG: NAD+ synthase, partial [Candidatus Omnitrophica bacterium]|nr:NAD+ synthase [Candidatus Omnitrophota bacterium]
MAGQHMIRVALAQINTTVGDFTGNQNKIESALEQSKALGVDVVVFPELAICGYPPEDLLHKNHFVEKNLKVLDEIAIKTQGIHAVIGFVQAKDSHIYNAAAIVGNGRIYGVYQKQELPNYGVFDEKRYFEPGHSNGLFSLNGVLIGINICEDIWVDNAGYLQQAKSGASLLINISSSPYEIGKPVVRRDLIVRRAKDTDTFVCYANLVGGQDELVFDGGSFIVDPAGKVVAQAKRFNEDLVVADLPVEARNPSGALSVISLGDSKTVSKCEIEGKNSEVFFIEEDEEVYSALVLGTRDYIKKNGFKKAVIGLSGGIDSALVAAIACDAIGAGNVIGISMPTKFNSKGTRADARKLAENLHMEFHEIPIKKLMTAYEATLDPWFYGRPPDIAEENLQARIRGNIIMAFSNKFGWLVLTTGNK